MCHVCVMVFFKYRLKGGGGTDCCQMVKAATGNGRIIFMHLGESGEVLKSFIICFIKHLTMSF